jgi:hypothetical protein
MAVLANAANAFAANAPGWTAARVDRDLVVQHPTWPLPPTDGRTTITAIVSADCSAVGKPEAAGGYSAFRCSVTWRNVTLGYYSTGPSQVARLWVRVPQSGLPCVSPVSVAAASKCVSGSAVSPISQYSTTPTG